MVLLFLAGPSLALAGLGDTIAETKLRFGEPLDRTVPPVKPAETAMWFQKDGYDVLIGFYLGKSCYINYSKKGQALTDQEIEQLKHEHASAVGWNPNPANIEQEKMLRTDGLAIFTLTPYDFMQASQPNTPWFISKPWLEIAVDVRKKLERDGFGKNP